MNNKTITKNVAFLTLINILMQTLGLLVNVCITQNLGASTVGSISLLGTFYGLMCVVASGNVFMCTSRLGSEEEGKCGNSEKILIYSLCFSLMITAATCFCVLFFSDFFLAKINGICSKKTIVLLCFGLPLASMGAALKGYFNAKRLQYIPAFADVTEFLVKSAVLMFFVQFLVCENKSDIFTAFAVSIICGESTSLLFMFIMKKIKCCKCKYAVSMKFSKFITLALPIMMNSYVCAVLSSTNDFLMPLCLRQSGDDISTALAKFGIFEAIVLPILFFPSCVVTSLCSIILPEVSRANGENSKNGIAKLAEKGIKTTIVFSVFVGMIFFFKGEMIACCISGEELAGKTLRSLSVVIPFIYLEIILEAIIKGLGKHGFSSLNYLAEYVVRISLLLVCVPLMGFTGVIVSYAASNILSNLARLIMLNKLDALIIKPFEFVVLPLVLSFISVGFSRLICSKIIFANDLLNVVIFCICALLIYIMLYSFVTSVFEYNNKRFDIIKNQEIV